MRRTTGLWLLTSIVAAHGCTGASEAPSGADAANEVLTRAQIEAAIMPLQAQWPLANASNDCLVFDGLFADDFFYVQPDGTVVGKEQWVQDCQADTSTGTSENSDVVIHAASSEFAVTSGLNHSVGVDADGNEFDVWGRWTNVWANRNGAWVAVAGHNSSLPGAPRGN